MPDYSDVLVATLGGQPQIITFTLDLLLQRGFPINEVIVLHPATDSQPRIKQALLHLNAEFASDYYQEYDIDFHSYVLEFNGQPIDDIINDEYADGTLDSIHRLITDLKRRGHRIHLSVSGGRRMIALLAISVAALNFDRYDHIWHLYTPDPIQVQSNEGKLMHMPLDIGPKLIQGQFLALGAYSPSSGLSFRAAQKEQREQIETQEREHCAKVVNHITPTQLKVLQAFARGLRPQQVSSELGITLVTVNTHKTVLLHTCRDVWGIPTDEILNYQFLRDKFRDYFQEI